MKISDYIDHLIKIKAQNGDLDVETTSFDGERITARPPKIAYKAVLSGRKRKQKFASDFDETRGEMVCRI